jgi:hypothetical protein
MFRMVDSILVPRPKLGRPSLRGPPELGPGDEDGLIPSVKTISYPEQCLCAGEEGIGSGEIYNRKP